MSGYRKNQHYVPKLLMKPWVLQNNKRQEVLMAYHWNEYTNSVWCKDCLGTKAYCCQDDLVTVEAHADGRDVLEAKFFEEIDNKGAEAVQLLISDGAEALTGEQRKDFALLLLSLEARRPEILDRLRKDGPDFIRQQLNSDELLKKACVENAIEIPPADYVENHIEKLEDEVLLSVLPELTKSRRVLPEILGCRWLVRRFSDGALKLAFSDRPLIRYVSSNASDNIWGLPLTPEIMFVASPNSNYLRKLERESENRLVRAANEKSVAQRDKYVFCVDKDARRWLSKQMRRGRRLAAHI